MIAQTDPVLAEIDALRAQQLATGARIALLRRLRSRPAVVPVLVYDRHWERCEEPSSIRNDDSDPLESAYRELEGLSEARYCYPVGISVNGVLIPMRDLWDRFGDLD